jgi:NADPH-dependent ferric siderophore reductase
MPTVPATLASSAERLFGRPATVRSVTDLSPALRRVRLEVPALAGRPWVRGQEVEFRVAPRELRHYTLANVDEVSGVVEILFALHATGPGTEWARALTAGEHVEVLGPGGGLRRKGGASELFLGDATALGLFTAIMPTAAAAEGAVEVPADELEAAAALLPGLDVVPAGAEPGAALRAWLHEHHPAVVTGGDAAGLPRRATLAGHGRTIQALRSRIRLLGMPRSLCVTKLHWETGRRGL